MPIEIARRRPPSELIPTDGCYSLVTGFEGFKSKAYSDPASLRAQEAAKKPEDRSPNWQTLPGDPWTFGFGFTEGVKEGDEITYSAAMERLIPEVAKRAEIVRRSLFDEGGLPVNVTQGEFNALVSLVYNLKSQRIPPTMLAYLRGGLTDKGDRVGPRDYQGAMYEFPRNCRARGMPMRGLYRRRLAEACEFSSLPWGSACSENLVKLKYDKAGKIDWDETTTLEHTLSRARQDIPLQKPPVDLKRPWPTTETLVVDKLPAKEDSGPTPTPIPEPLAPVSAQPPEDDLLLEEPQAAPVIATPDSRAAPVETTQSPPVAVPVPTPQPQAVPGGKGGAVAPKMPPMPPSFPPSPQVSNQTDYGPGIKNMFRSKRFWGGFILIGGRIIIAADAAGHMPWGIGTFVRGFIGDGVLMDWTTGLFVNLIGEAVMDRGEKKATMPLGTPKEVALATPPPVKA